MRAFILFIAIGLGCCVPASFLSDACALDLAQRQTSPIAAETISPNASGTGSEPAGEGWRRVHGSSTNGAPAPTAILHTADFERSDPRLAGLMLRCGEHGVEAVIVVVEPFPPHARPKITLRASGHEFNFEGEIIPTGAGIRLPVDGASLVSRALLGAKELGINIEDRALTVDGVVALAGLAQAFQTLNADCLRN